MSKDKKLKKLNKQIKKLQLSVDSFDDLKGIYIKKKDVNKIKSIDRLREIYDNISDNKDQEKVHRLFLARKSILKNAADLYIDLDEDDLFDDTVIELKVLGELLSL